MLEDRAISMAMNGSSFENVFKQARALVVLKRPDQALIKFRTVCEMIENVLRTNPSAALELRLVPLSLTEISDIYKAKDDLDKALAFMQCARKFLEYMSANKPNKEDEPSDDGCEHEEYTLGALFVEMHKAFEMKDAPPKPDPEEIVRMFQEAKKKREEEIARENMQKLKDALAAKKERLRTSRWARFVEYVNDHPVGIAIGSVVFLSIFLIFALVIFSSGDNESLKNLRNARKEERANSKMNGRRERTARGKAKEAEKQKKTTYDPKAEQEKLRKLMEQFDSMSQKEKENNEQAHPEPEAQPEKAHEEHAKHEKPAYSHEL